MGLHAREDGKRRGVAPGRARHRMAGIALVAIAALLLEAPGAAARTGGLRVHVSGLPRGARADVLVSGPHGFRRRLTRVGATRIGGARPGRYVVRVAAVRLGAHGRVRRGAVARPVQARLAVRVHGGRTTVVQARYGTIVNPGLVPLAATVVGVIGDPAQPDGLVLAHVRRIAAVGGTLSLPPSARLPHGVLARVTSERRRGRRLIVRLRPVPVTDVAPVLVFDVPVQVGRSSSAACSGSGITPYAGFGNVHVSGTIETASWTGPHVSLQVDLDVDAGVKVLAALGFDCSLSAKSLPLRGFVAGVPIYGQLKGELSAALQAAAELKAGVTVPATFGARSVGVPPLLVWEPILHAGSPRVSASFTEIAQLRAAAGVGVEVGVGDPRVNVHVDVDSDVSFTAQPGSCSFDVDLGQFSVGGKILRFSISSPKTPPIFHQNLWRGCDRAFAVGNPGAQQGNVGLPVRLQLQTSGDHAGAVSYSATGLPAGLSLDPATGVVSGFPTAAGSTTAVVTARDAGGHVARATFGWTIAAGGPTFFDGSPGTGAPPPTLGPYAMTSFPPDPSDLDTPVSSVDGPTGPIAFDAPLTHLQVANGWQTWSNGYGGDVYMASDAADDGTLSTTIALPPGTGAFVLYAEPDIFADFAMSATAQDGTTSGPLTVYGYAGAQYLGFYESCGHTLASIHVVDAGGDTGLGIGEFAIAPELSCSASPSALAAALRDAVRQAPVRAAAAAEPTRALGRNR